MNPDTFAEWFRRQGHHVIRTESSYWYDAGPRVFQAFPYQWIIQPTEEEIRKLLLKRGILALRYSTPLEAPDGAISYHVILHNPYNLDMLRSQARNGVKKGLGNCQVERISFERLADEGWNLQQDTLDRQGRLRSMTQTEWRRLCLAASDLAGFEAWAAIVSGELAAAILTARIDDLFCVPYAASHRKFMNIHVNNALFFTASCDILNREGISGMFFTLQSLDAPPSVDDFKFRMGLCPKAVCQRVVFHPVLKPITNERMHSLLKKLMVRYPENPSLAKAEGMLRFNLKGRVPLASQDWPEVLAEEKTKFLVELPTN
jgi:hypothetical protein